MGSKQGVRSLGSLSPTLGRKGKNKKNKISNVQVYNWLKTISNKRGSCGLLHYIVQNKKEETSIQNDLSVVLNNIPNAAKLALKVLQGYKFSKYGIIWACILVLESLYPIFCNDDNATVPLHVKDSAWEIAK